MQWVDQGAQHEQSNNAEQLLQHYLTVAFPDLERGIEHLDTCRRHLPHWKQVLGDQPVTADWLQRVISQEYENSPLSGPVQQVLDCLILLSHQLHEDLFVDYHHGYSVRR